MSRYRLHTKPGRMRRRALLTKLGFMPAAGKGPKRLASVSWRSRKWTLVCRIVDVVV